MKTEQLTQIHALNQAFAEVERKLMDEVTLLRHHKQEGAVQLETIQRQVEQERLEREQKHIEQEQTFTSQLQAIQQEAHALAIEKNELEDGFALRLAALQQQAAQKNAEQARKHSEQEQALQSQFAEREQALNQQLQAGQEELRRLEQNWAQREKELGEQTSQACQELESLARTLAQREQEVTTQLLALQQQAAQENAEQIRRHNQQERSIQKEYELQVHAAKQELRDAEQEFLRRERELTKQIGEARQEREKLLRIQYQREQDVAAQLLAIERETRKETAEHSRKHSEQERALYREHAQKEHAFNQHRQNLLKELSRLEQERTLREKEHGELIRQAKDESETLLRAQILREREVSIQLLTIQQQAAQDKADLALNHAEQTQALQKQCSVQEQVFNQQIQQAQYQLRLHEQDWAYREKALAKEVASLQSEAQVLRQTQQLQVQQHEAEINCMRTEHDRLTQACAALEDNLNAEIQSERQTILRLQQALTEVQQHLDMTHASLIWRITTPLRMLASSIYRKTYLGPHAANSLATGSSHVISSAKSESPPTSIQPIAIESIMSAPVQATNAIPTAVASSLDELLAYHDQHFVHCAYQTLLGREPDPVGLGYYVGRLRTGHSKIQILAQLRNSQEGKDYAAELPGLDVAIQRYQRMRNPVIGWLFRWLDSSEGNRAIDHELRAIQSQIFLLGDESNRRLNQMEATLTELHHLVVHQAQSIIVSLAGAPTVDTSKAASDFIQPSLPEGGNQLPLRAREIYFQLITAASKSNAGRGAQCVS